LAQGLSYSLYQHDRSAIVYRQGDTTPFQTFAEKFALYFLIPSEALAERLYAAGVKVVSSPTEVVHLSHYFNVSYETMIYRLEQENRIVVDLVDFKAIDPAVLARHLGYSYSYSQDSNSFISLEKRHPRIFIELAYRAIEEEKLSLRRVAEMLGISDIELEDRLYVEARKEVEEILS
jgi:hypothetical protein